MRLLTQVMCTAGVIITPGLIQAAVFASIVDWLRAIEAIRAGRQRKNESGIFSQSAICYAGGFYSKKNAEGDAKFRKVFARKCA